MKGVRIKQEWLAGLLMILPYLLFYLVFSLYPVLQGFKLSLHKWSLFGDHKFIGLKNYVDLLADPKFLRFFGYTLYFAVLTVPLFTVVGLLLALLVNRLVRGKTFFRSIYFYPYILSVSVISSIWLVLFQPYTGEINGMLKWLGIEQEIFWLTDPGLAWIALVIASLWWTIGFNFVLFLAALQDIPDALYEAAAMDGANSWQTFWNITLPSLSRVTVLVVILQTIASLKLFGQSYLITGGGPAEATRTMIFYIYDKGFTEWELGYASAIGFYVLLIIGAISLVQFKLLQRHEGGNER